MYYTMSYASPLGAMTLAANETALVGLWFDGQKYDMEGLNGAEVTEKETPVLKKAVQWLDEYFAGRMPAIMSLPLAPEGNEFRRRVWSLLCQIPTGRRRPMASWPKPLKHRRENRCRLKPLAVLSATIPFPSSFPVTAS